jgi:hypothetical protein
MLTYRAIIINKTSGKRDVLRLGRAGSINNACRLASQKCPDGWVIFDVYKV